MYELWGFSNSRINFVGAQTILLGGTLEQPQASEAHSKSIL